MLATESPFPQFFDTDGDPLDAGYLYFGVAGQNPETSPITVHWDAAGTQPAAQPIRTLGGYPARNGSPANVFASGDYSLTVRSKAGAIVYHAPNSADYSNAATLQAQIAAITSSVTAPADPAKGAGYIPLDQGIAYAAGTLGDHARHGEWLATDYPWLCDPTGVADSSTARDAFLAACAAAKKIAKFPAGTYKFNTPISVVKPNVVRIRGETSLYANGYGTTFTFPTVTDAAVIVGVADGNPDVTGATQDFLLSDVTLVSSNNADTAVRITNTTQARLERVRTRGFDGKIFDCAGGNVMLTIRECEPFGTKTPGCVGIHLGDYQFGHFVVDIAANHIGSAGYGIRFGGGRAVHVHRNTIEQLSAGIFKMDGATDLSDLTIDGHNYIEACDGLAFDWTGYSGTLYKIAVRDNEFWPSASANYGFGNVPRNRIGVADIGGNLIPDSAWNTKFALGLPYVWTSTAVFDATTTASADQVTGREYEDALAYALRPNDMLKLAGDMTELASNAPFGWTNLSAAPWQILSDPVFGRYCCYSPAAAEYDKCQKVIALTPVNRTRYFALAVTYKGWGALRVDGNLIWDSGAATSDVKTIVTRWSIAANAASMTLKFGTNTANLLVLAEVRLYEIGVGDYFEPGQLNNALDKAVKRCLKRGEYV